jgi:hypothetical protein
MIAGGSRGLVQDSIPLMRFTLELQTDGSNDILNLSAELKPHLRELRGEAAPPP